MSDFTPNCLPLLIGSLPIDDHREAAELIFTATPKVPIWPQLPVYPEEGMIPQFLAGFPGVTEKDGKTWIEAEGEEFDAEFLAFFEEYLMVTEGAVPLEGSRFALTEDIARGFFEFCRIAESRKDSLETLKGQITGPITFCTGVVDQGGRAIFYNDQLRDAAVKMLTLKAQYQAQKMKAIAGPPIVFFDEPGLSGFGSSAFITITRDDIVDCLAECFAGVKAEGGLVGVHVCANTEWSLLLDAGVDIVSYDAYSYFDRLELYADQLKSFMENGGVLATGIIPTSGELIDTADSDDLTKRWFDQTERLEKIGIDREVVYRQTFITPSCGTGTVTEAQAMKVLELTRDVSAKVREKFSS
jgi:methionine synthase II (cobalamin-independent)